MSLGDLLKLTDAGVTVADYEDIRAELQVAFKGIYGADAQIGPETMDGQLLDLFALAVRDTGNMAAAVYNNQNPLTASGDALRRWVTLQGLTPKAPTPSTLNIFVTVQDAAAQKNTQYGKVRFSEAGNPGVVWTWDGVPPAYQTPEARNIYFGPVLDGKIVFAAIAVCETTGPVSATSKPGDTLPIISVEQNASSLVRVTAGALVLTPADPAVPGSVKSYTWLEPVQASLGLTYESDDALRLRMQNSNAIRGSSTVDALQASLNNIVGVREAKVYENALDSSAPITTYSSFSMEAHSILCLVRSPYILPVTSYVSPLVKQIFDTISAKKSPGCGVSTGIGNASPTAFGTPIGTGPIQKFLLVAPIPVEINITVAQGRSYTDALEKLIKKAVVAYFDTVLLGQIVYVPDVTCVVRDVIQANGGGSKVVGASFAVQGRSTDRWNGAEYFYGYPAVTMTTVQRA